MPRHARIPEKRSLHVALRSSPGHITSFPTRSGEAGSQAGSNGRYAGAGHVVTSLPAAMQPSAAYPIWFAALIASACLAEGNGGNHTIPWNCVSGRALYTNRGRDAERIEPLGVRLLGGETLAVYWVPGETSYTLEVYGQNERCA